MQTDGDPRSLRAAPLACPKTLVLSCGSEEVHLWDVANMGTGPLHTFEGCCGAAFDAARECSRRTSGVST